MVILIQFLEQTLQCFHKINLVISRYIGNQI